MQCNNAIVFFCFSLPNVQGKKNSQKKQKLLCTLRIIALNL